MSKPTRAALLTALAPFAKEGAKWLTTSESHDNLTRPAWLRALLALLLLALLIPLSAGAQTGPWPGGMSLPTVAGGTCPITRCWAGTGPPPEEPAITLNEARAICERHTHFSQYGGGGDIPGFVVDKDEQQLCERVARAQNKADLAALKAFVDGMKP